MDPDLNQVIVQESAKEAGEAAGQDRPNEAGEADGGEGRLADVSVQKAMGSIRKPIELYIIVILSFYILFLDA